MNMTSGLGSIALEHGRKNASYSISKTAINMLVSVKSFHILSEWLRSNALTVTVGANDVVVFGGGWI